MRVSYFSLMYLCECGPSYQRYPHNEAYNLSHQIESQNHTATSVCKQLGFTFGEFRHKARSRTHASSTYPLYFIALYYSFFTFGFEFLLIFCILCNIVIVHWWTGYFWCFAGWMSKVSWFLYYSAEKGIPIHWNISKSNTSMTFHTC